jgi:SNF2 family DNA or RNA helicase
MSDTPQRSVSAANNSDTYVLKDFKLSALSAIAILKHSSGPADTTTSGYFDLHPEEIALDYASFISTHTQIPFPRVTVRLDYDILRLNCGCTAQKNRLCEHQTRVLFNMLKRPEIRAFFDESYRHETIRTFAKAYGLENEVNPDQFFAIAYTNKKLEVIPLIKDLLPVTKEKNAALEELLLADLSPAWNLNHLESGTAHKIILLKQHRYYAHFQVDLAECNLSSNGKIKNPIKQLNAMDFLWTNEHVDELKFYTAITRFQNNYEPDKPDAEIEGLKALVKNPLNLPVFYHDAKVSANLTSSSLKPVWLKNTRIDINLSVDLKNNFYSITAELVLAGKAYDLKLLNLKYKYFIFYNEGLHLIDNTGLLKIVEFFRQNNNHLVIHESKFADFQQDILAKLENKIHIHYAYLKPASTEQLKESNFDLPPQKIIYLSDSEDFILLNPVMKYGEVEIPVLSRKQIYTADKSGHTFTVNRNKEDELGFITAINRAHPHFAEQQGQQWLYLHKKRFLEQEWFLSVFEQWQAQDITIMGFNELKGNRVNPNKMKISIAVKSGLNWFDSDFEVKFGKEKVTLKAIQRSIRNRSKFVKLGDGTMGILPQEWIDKFTAYFNAGEVNDDTIRTPKVNFQEIADLYEDEVLSIEVQLELAAYHKKIGSFKNIEAIRVPESLNGTLRDYQKEGLNWLNFLDEFGFGGCLADDMGLGKTIQIIAFILTQREKVKQNTNLIVVPTSLLFNWQAEIAKFAPDLKLHTIYGADRLKGTAGFDDYEVVLTSYGTLMYDIGWLKKYAFNYIFLDESQTIKNPESLRYNAVRLLQSRNKIVMTGTPIENNTFDLYGQLSFACPGLLGSKQFFKDHYSTPIDRFKDNTRAVALRKKVSPFILRRTKKEVAAELPDKTEMVIYCEMGTAQKSAYDACKNEYRNFLLKEPEDDLPKHSLHVLKGLTQLRQICNSPALLKDDMIHGVASSKITTLIEEIQSHGPQHKILVFSQFVGMLDLIKKELQTLAIPFEYLTGQTRNREKSVTNFQENAEVRVFLISLKAGGMGLNLTEADYVYIVDPWWNPAVENQAIDRCYRIGQKKNVIAVRLICPDTIEEKIMLLQDTKKELVNDIIQTDSSLLKTLSKQDLLALFS